MNEPANKNGQRPPTGAEREPQIGASDRGPAELDQAKDNRALPAEAVVSGPGDERPLASGRTEDEELEAEEDSPEPGEASKPALRREPRARPAEQDEQRAEAESQHPGGDRPSESERPASPRSRWGKGPEGHGA